MSGNVLKFPDRLDTPFCPRAEPATIIELPVVHANDIPRPQRSHRLRSTPEQVELRRQARRQKLEAKKFFFEEAGVHAAVVYLARNDLPPAAVVDFIRVGNLSPFIAEQIDRDLFAAEAWLTAFAACWRAFRKDEPVVGPVP